MRRFVYIAIILLVVCMPLSSVEGKPFDVVFDTQPYNPFFAEFGFRISENQAIEKGEVAFSSPTLGNDAVSAQLQLEAYWSITSEDDIELSLVMNGPLGYGEGDSRKTIDWTVEFAGDKSLSSAEPENLQETIHCHDGVAYVNDSGRVALRGKVTIPYSSDEFEAMALAEYRGTLTMKVTSVGAGE